MIYLFSKCALVAICLRVIAADMIDPPPCEQVARNAVMCTYRRFRQQCPRECGDYKQTRQNNGNGANVQNTNNVQGSNDRSSINVNNKEEVHKEKHTSKQKSKEATPSTPVHRDDDHTTTETQTTTSSAKVTTTTQTTTSSPSTTKQHSNEKAKSKDANRSAQKTTANRNSAGASKNCNKIDPCVDAGTANAGFRKRCQAAGIADTCLDKCRYDVTFDELKKAMLSKQCPIGGMRDYLEAGANQQDNRVCCEKTGVLEGKLAFCFPFCNPSGNDWPASNQAMKYMPCASQLNAIMRCHWAGLTQ